MSWLSRRSAGDLARSNRAAILGFEFLWGIGVPFVQATTTLPGYLKALGASGLLIGLVPAVFSGGIALVQPFSLFLIRPGPRRFRNMLWAYRIGASFYLLMAASVLLLPPDAIALRLAAFFACYLGFVLVAGAGDPHYVGAIVDSIEPRERGWFFGLRLVWFGVGGLLGGMVAGPVLRALPSPGNFGLSMLFGCAFILVATFWFARFRPVAKPEPDARPALLDCLTDVWHLALRRRQFLMFLLGACVFVLAQGPFTFLALFIKERLNAGDAILGRLSAVFMACGLVSSLAMGYAGDRFGHRRAYMTGVALFGVGLACALVLQSEAGLYLAYFLAAAYNAAWAVPAFNVGYECSGEPDAARVYAGISLVVAPLRIVGPIGAGAAVDHWGHAPVFAGAILLSALALVLVALLPHDGRSAQQTGTIA